MLPAIVVILFFIGALIAAFGMFAAYAIKEQSKHDLNYAYQCLWILVAIGGVISGWQTIEVLNSGARFGM